MIRTCWFMILLILGRVWENVRDITQLLLYTGYFRWSVFCVIMLVVWYATVSPALVNQLPPRNISNKNNDYLVTRLRNRGNKEQSRIAVLLYWRQLVCRNSPSWIFMFLCQLPTTECADVTEWFDIVVLYCQYTSINSRWDIERDTRWRMRYLSYVVTACHHLTPGALIWRRYVSSLPLSQCLSGSSVTI